MLTQLYLLKIVTGLHCGVGQGVNDIDLPTARDAVSGHPNAPGSSIKGVLRDFHWEKTAAKNHPDHRTVEAIFGPDAKDSVKNPDRPIDFASCVSFGDAQLVCLPVRSYHGTFAYLTSPLALTFFKAALVRAGFDDPALRNLAIPKLAGANLEIALPTKCPSQLVPPTGKNNRQVLLEDIDLTASDNGQFISAADGWMHFIVRLLSGRASFEPALFRPRFAIVCDEVFDHLCETALPVVVRNAIDATDGVVRDGALWSEEFIPPESILCGLLHAEPSRRGGLDEQSALEFLMRRSPPVLQFGGKATTGRGLAALAFPKPPLPAAP